MSYDSLDDIRKLTGQRNIDAIVALGPPPPEIEQTELQYPAVDGRKLLAKLYKPTTKLPLRGGSPLIVMYHGGGFCVGHPDSQEQDCRNFVQAFGAVCLSVSYGLAPEFPFPYAVKDSWEALKWAAVNARSWGADLFAGFIVGGVSAGGNIAAVLAHLAREEKLSPPLTGQYLCIPTLLPPAVVPDKYKEYYLSYEQNKDAPVVSVAALDMFMRVYKPDDNDSILYAIFNHPKGHAGLPPVLFQVDGLDPLRDEAILYEHVLKEEGVRTKLYVYPGLPHGHFGFFPFLKSSDKFRVDQVEGFGWLLGRTPDFSNIVTKAQAAGV